MIWVGLTGVMGSGKSTALKCFKELGLGAASADDVVHELYQDPEVVQEVCEALGISPQEFSRERVASLVFKNKKMLRSLESIIHPKIRKKVAKIKKDFIEQGLKASVYEVPLLFEKNMDDLFDVTVCIGVDSASQLSRLKKRNGWSEGEINSRLLNQMTLDEKRIRADHYIDNSGSVDDLKKSCKQVYEKILDKS